MKTEITPRLGGTSKALASFYLGEAGSLPGGCDYTREDRKKASPLALGKTSLPRIEGVGHKQGGGTGQDTAKGHLKATTSRIRSHEGLVSLVLVGQGMPPRERGKKKFL